MTHQPWLTSGTFLNVGRICARSLTIKDHTWAFRLTRHLQLEGPQPLHISGRSPSWSTSSRAKQQAMDYQHHLETTKIQPQSIETTKIQPQSIRRPVDQVQPTKIPSTNVRPCGQQVADSSSTYEHPFGQTRGSQTTPADSSQPLENPFGQREALWTTSSGFKFNLRTSLQPNVRPT
jgi:hypothetical protein